MNKITISRLSTGRQLGEIRIINPPSVGRECHRDVRSVRQPRTQSDRLRDNPPVVTSALVLPYKKVCARGCTREKRDKFYALHSGRKSEINKQCPYRARASGGELSLKDGPRESKLNIALSSSPSAWEMNHHAICQSRIPKASGRGLKVPRGTLISFPPRSHYRPKARIFHSASRPGPFKLPQLRKCLSVSRPVYVFNPMWIWVTCSLRWCLNETIILWSVQLATCGLLYFPRLAFQLGNNESYAAQFPAAFTLTLTGTAAAN